MWFYGIFHKTKDMVIQSTWVCIRTVTMASAGWRYILGCHLYVWSCLMTAPNNRTQWTRMDHLHAVISHCRVGDDSQVSGLGYQLRVSKNCPPDIWPKTYQIHFGCAFQFHIKISQIPISLKRVRIWSMRYGSEQYLDQLKFYSWRKSKKHELNNSGSNLNQLQNCQTTYYSK